VEKIVLVYMESFLSTNKAEMGLIVISQESVELSLMEQKLTVETKELENFFT